MEKLKAFLKRKDIVFSAKRYGIDALGAMAQGLFCSLLIGTIINTIGSQFHIAFLTNPVATIGGAEYTVGGLATAMSGPAMAVAIGNAIHCPPMVLYSLITVGFASNALGGAGGPLSVLFIAIIAGEVGKAISKETKVDILITPLVTIGVGVALSAWWAPALGKAAMKVGDIIMWATELQPFFMGILVAVVVGCGNLHVDVLVFLDLRVGRSGNDLDIVLAQEVDLLVDLLVVNLSRRHRDLDRLIARKLASRLGLNLEAVAVISLVCDEVGVFVKVGLADRVERAFVHCERHRFADDVVGDECANIIFSECAVDNRTRSLAAAEAGDVVAVRNFFVLLLHAVSDRSALNRDGHLDAIALQGFDFSFHLSILHFGFLLQRANTQR